MARPAGAGYRPPPVALDDPRFALLALCVLAGFAAEATVGFGAVVITLALASVLYPLDVLLATIVPLNLSLSLVIAARHHDHADRRLILRRILPAMAAGMAVGFALLEVAPRALLQRLFGGFVTALAGFELARLGLRVRRRAARDDDELNAAGRRRAGLETAALLGAGVTHGLFSSGGPLLVWSLERTGLSKSVFRSTLSIVWIVLGVALNAGYALAGRLTEASLLAAAALLPVVGLAIVAGEWLHHRLDETWFRRAIFALLLVAGLANLL